MAFLTMTYSFTNGTAADAGQVNTNNTDIINATSDGTKDFNIAALTCAGTATFNGNVLLGNASGDDVQFNGSLATSIPVKTTATYNFGSATLGLLSLYLSLGATYTVRILGNSSGASASYTLTLPATDGATGDVLYNTDGAGTLGWRKPGIVTVDNAAGASGETITSTDEETRIYTPTAAITVKLDNSFAIGRLQEIINDGTGADDIITVTANDDTTICQIYPEQRQVFRCTTGSPSTNTSWRALNPIRSNWLSVTVTSNWNNDTITCYRKREGDTAKYRLKLALSGAHGGANLAFTIPDTIDSTKIHNTANNRESVGQWTAYDGGTVQPCGFLTLTSTTTVLAMRFTDSGTTQSLASEDGSAVTLSTGDEVYANFEVPISGWKEFSG